VRSGTDEAVAGAAVQLWRVGGSESDSYVVVATPSGEFAFKDVKSGDYHLAATHPGYMRFEYGQRGPHGRGVVVTLGEGEAVRGLSLALTQTAAIYGRIYDRAGAAVANAQVQAMKYVYQGDGRTLDAIKATLTNDLGEYRLFWLPPGQYLVSATVLPGSLPNTMVVPIEGGTFTAMRTLSSGTGALIGVPDEAVGLPLYFPGTVDVRSAQPLALSPGDNRGGIDIQIDHRNAHRIRGFVTGRPSIAPDERAFTQIQLISRGNLVAPANLPGGTVDPITGAFEMRNVPPGEYYLRASVTFPQAANRSFLYGRASVDVFDKDIENLTIRLEPGGSIRVRVSVENQPSDNADVKRIRISSSAGDLERSPEQSDVFLKSNVAPGTYRVWGIDLPRQAYMKSARMGVLDVLTDGVTLDPQHPERLQEIEVVISTRGAAVEGVAVNERLEPMRDVKVVLVPEVLRRQRIDLYKVAPTDSGGRFRISGIAPGDYSVFVWEDVEDFAWMDPDFLKPFENQATRIRAVEGGSETLQLRISPQR
jgi:hypothetical protein